MSNTTTTPATGGASITDTTEPTTDPSPTEKVEFWRSKAREQEKRAKENADAAKRLAEIEAVQKTEEQRAAERVAAAEQRAVELEFRANAAEAAAASGLPLDVVLGPKKQTAEALQEYAALVRSLIGDAGKLRTPQPDPSQGRTLTSSASPGDQFAAFLSRQLK